MRVLRVHAWGQPPLIEERAEPQPSPGRTLVRMQAATVGHIDRSVWGGNFPRYPPLPYTPGLEAAGVVLASERFAVGARVWLRGGGLGTQTDGTWCETIAAPDACIGVLPDNVSMPLGSAFFSPCTSAWVALHEVGALREGEHVLVTGASGAVGSIAVQLAVQRGARVSAVVSDAAQAAALPAGVQALIVDRSAPAGLDTCGADLLIDTVGGALLAAALPGVLPGGRTVLVGYTGGTAFTLDLAHFCLRDVALLPLNMLRRDAAGRAMAPELLARIGDGRLQLAVTTFPLAEAARALEWITQRGHHGRAVLVGD